MARRRRHRPAQDRAAVGLERVKGIEPRHPIALSINDLAIDEARTAIPKTIPK